MDVKRYGPWAVIIGGSEGVGAGFARKLAAAGFNLVLVARKEQPLRDLAQELGSPRTQVRVASVDMSKPDALDRVRAVTDDVEVGCLIYNAGANNTRGTFVELDPVVYRDMIGLNVTSPSEFARHFGGLMRQRQRGGMIFVGSLAGFMGSPSVVAYCAAKAYSRILCEGLWAEGQQHGVDVLHLVVGFTATPAMERLGFNLTTAQPPEEAAQEGIDNIANGPLWVAGGARNWEVATERCKIVDRAAAVRKFATPPRNTQQLGTQKA